MAQVTARNDPLMLLCLSSGSFLVCEPVAVSTGEVRIVGFAEFDATMSAALVLLRVGWYRLPQNPERFLRKPPAPPTIETAIWINKPEMETATNT